MPISNFYLRHKGLFINLFSVITFLGIHHSLGEGGPDTLGKMPWLALLFIVLFFLEPWATRYSMGAFNQRRETAGLSPILLHRWMRMIFPAIIFWGGRIAILGALFVFYLPVRYIYTVEDFTFAQTKWRKAEQVVSFLLVFLGFLLAR